MSNVELVAVRGTSFLKYSPPTVRLAIPRLDMERYRADGWDVYDFGLERVAERPLTLCDGDIGLITVLSAENLALADAGKPHNGAGRVKCFIFFRGRWRALDLNALCGHDNKYASGQALSATLAMVQEQIRLRARTLLEFRASALRPRQTSHRADLAAAE
jgi:hypothetical protein